MFVSNLKALLHTMRDAISEIVNPPMVDKKQTLDEFHMQAARKVREEADAAFAKSDYSTPRRIASRYAPLIYANPYYADTLLFIAHRYRKANALIAIEVARLAVANSCAGSALEKRTAASWKRHVKAAYGANFKQQAVGAARSNFDIAKPGSALQQAAAALLEEWGQDEPKIAMQPNNQSLSDGRNTLG
jgi:hypothetical protein